MMEITTLTAICAKSLLWKMPNIWLSIALFSKILVFTPIENNFHLVMGKAPPGVNFDITFEMYRKIASSVYLMYSVLVKAREGFG